MWLLASAPSPCSSHHKRLKVAGDGSDRLVQHAYHINEELRARSHSLIVLESGLEIRSLTLDLSNISTKYLKNCN